MESKEKKIPIEKGCTVTVSSGDMKKVILLGSYNVLGIG